MTAPGTQERELGPSVSIVIPVLDDHGALARCLDSLARQVGAPPPEILVVDASRTDDASAVCAQQGTTWMRARPGRATQMNAGARTARGELLWFLHADTWVPPDALAALVDAAAVSPAKGGATWGAFRQRIDHPSPLVRVIERGANARARLARLPYGDQGLFVRRGAFEAVTGFPEEPFLEDLLLARRLGRLAAPRLLPPTLVSDGRRWHELGVVRTTLRNWQILCLHALGRPPTELARLYGRPRETMRRAAR